jgi:hypothetical protein
MIYNLCYWTSNRLRITSLSFLQNYRYSNNLKYTYKFMYSTHISTSRYALFSQVLYTVCCSSKLYAHKNVRKPKLVNVFDNKAAAQIGTNDRARGVNARLLARSHFASGRYCDRPTRSRFSVAFLGPRANAELVPKFHVALHVSHAALPMVTFKFRPNVALLMSN